MERNNKPSSPSRPTPTAIMISDLYNDVYHDLLLAGFELTEHEHNEFRKIIGNDSEVIEGD